MPEVDKKAPLGGLTRQLVERGYLKSSAAYEAQVISARENRPIVSILVGKKLATSEAVAECAHLAFRLPLLNLEALDLELIPRSLVDEKLILKHHVLPIMAKKKQLYVALSDPTNLNALNEIQFSTSYHIEPILVREDQLASSIEQVLSHHERGAFDDLGDTSLDDLEITDAEESFDEGTPQITDDAPIVRFVNKILVDAIRQGASDIHFEPYEKLYRIRYRHDGVLNEVATPPNHLAARLAARLKVMSRLDISERRVPQDGRFKMKLSQSRSIDFRVSTCPTLFGEKVVLRILDPMSAQLGIDALGFEEAQRNALLTALQKPQGMILVTGPTGSGKTVTLYTALNLLNTPERNISTAEDPVEINLVGINQVNVHPKAGLDFSVALRSFLRQDPDVVMVGEIRDLETAEIAVKASQTGHLVLSTLHTNSAPETLTRLLNMGVASYNLATSVSLVIAQRLARKLCEHCKEQRTSLPKESLKSVGFQASELEQLVVYGSVGCEHCNQTGYRGRVGIYEVMPISQATARIILAGGNAIDLADQALKEGVKTLYCSGLEKVRQGITSIEEINRVTKE